MNNSKLSQQQIKILAIAVVFILVVFFLILLQQRGVFVRQNLPPSEKQSKLDEKELELLNERKDSLVRSMNSVVFEIDYLIDQDLSSDHIRQFKQVVFEQIPDATRYTILAKIVETKTTSQTKFQLNLRTNTNKYYKIELSYKTFNDNLAIIIKDEQGGLLYQTN